MVNGWTEKPIGELGTFSKGSSVSRADSNSGKLPCIRYGEIYTTHNDYIKAFASFISPTVAQTAKQLKRGDLLFTGSGETKEEIGKCVAFIDDFEAYAGGDIIILSPNSDVDPLFMGFMLNTPSVAKQKARKGQGDAIVHITAKALGDITVLLPPLPEQRAIAAALSDADALIASLEKLIVKKRNIKQGAMQELLTGKRRLPGFDSEWEEKAIGSFARVVSGGTPSTHHQEYWGGSVPWMNSGELNYKRVHSVVGRITESGLENSSTTKVPPYSVLIGLAGQGKTRGTVAMNYFELCTNQSIAAVFPNPDVYSTEYLYQNLDRRYEELRELSTGDGGRGGLNLTIIRKLTIPFPKLAEQTAIATILSDMDAELDALTAKLTKARNIKQGIMQQLLAGAIRLEGEADA